MGSKSEWRRLRKFEQENEKLRREVSKLRKQMQVGHIDNLELRYDKVKKGEPAILPTCEQCGNNDIHCISLDRQDGHFEIRICKSCEYRTEMKKKKSKRSEEF